MFALSGSSPSVIACKVARKFRVRPMRAEGCVPWRRFHARAVKVDCLRGGTLAMSGRLSALNGRNEMDMCSTVKMEDIRKNVTRRGLFVIEALRFVGSQKSL